MKQLSSLFKRDDYKEHKFLKETKLNKKIWDEMLKEIKH